MFSKLNDKSSIIRKLGFWSSLSTAILNFWYLIAFISYQSILHAPWHGIEAYARTFQLLPFMAWVIPCFLLTIAFLIMITTLYTMAEDENKIWSLLALAFAIIYSAILSVNYYIQMTVVRHNIINKMLEGMSLWIYADRYPYTIPGALEGVGYLFMCLSFLCIAKTFGKEKLEYWTRCTFIATGISGLLVFTDPLFRLPLVLSLIDMGIAGIALTLGPLLLAVLFIRNLK